MRTIIAIFCLALLALPLARAQEPAMPPLPTGYRLIDADPGFEGVDTWQRYSVYPLPPVYEQIICGGLPAPEGDCYLNHGNADGTDDDTRQAVDFAGWTDVHVDYLYRVESDEPTDEWRDYSEIVVETKAGQLYSLISTLTNKSETGGEWVYAQHAVPGTGDWLDDMRFIVRSRTDGQWPTSFLYDVVRVWGKPPPRAYLPIVAKVPTAADSCGGPNLLTNCDLERGWGVGWREVSEYAIVCELPEIAYQGEWVIWLGGWDGCREYASQPLEYDTGVEPLRISFWWRLDTDEEPDAARDSFAAYVVHGAEVAAVLMEVDNRDEGGWRQSAFNVYGLLAWGQPLDLVFYAECDGDTWTSFYADYARAYPGDGLQGTAVRALPTDESRQFYRERKSMQDPAGSSKARPAAPATDNVGAGR